MCSSDLSGRFCWGPATYLASVEKARAIHPVPESSLNLPEARVIAIPLALLGFLARSFGTMVAAGSATGRVSLVLKADDRAGVSGSMTSKVESIERRLQG